MLLRVNTITNETDSIKTFELVDPEGLDLPVFSAGSHVDVTLPDGQLRQYSLCNSPAERQRYLLGVLREASGRGGSRQMHDRLVAGDLLQVSMPRNNFPLDESASRHLLIAGGIGVTPLMAMVHRLQVLNADFALHYCTRDAAQTAFCGLLAADDVAPHVRFHHDGGVPGRGLDVAALLSNVAPGTHVYCCGPAGLMAAVKAASAHWPTSQVHFEHFSAPVASAAASGSTAFEVEIASTGAVYPVPPDRSILSVLLDQGVLVDSSCEAGVCGTCTTRYLSGQPDHRDFVLSEAEQREHVMVCVSRSRSPRLKLDL
jgi:vanillate O-demethylase ferredoxin subunit